MAVIGAVDCGVSPIFAGHSDHGGLVVGHRHTQGRLLERQVVWTGWWSSTGSPQGHPLDLKDRSVARSDGGYKCRHLVVDVTAFGHQPTDLVNGVDNCGVVTSSKFSGDSWIAEVGDFPEDVHGHLTGGDEWTAPTGSDKVLSVKAIDLRGLGKY